MGDLRILALDTSTRACSVAILTGDGMQEDYRIVPREHNRLLLPMVDSLLKGQSITLDELDCIAFGQGPGSFTGLRIAVGVVQGLAYGAQVPVVPVSSLACLAQGYIRRKGAVDCLVAMKAREDEIYYGAYRHEAGLMRAITPDCLISLAEVEHPGTGNWVLIGDGWQHPVGLHIARDFNLPVVGEELLPQARDIAVIAAADFAAGKSMTAMDARPVYLREKVAQRKSTR